MSEFILPSDQDRADNDELDRVCTALEEVMGERDAMAALAEDRRQFIVNGVETGNIRPPWDKDDPASSVYKACNLEPSLAVHRHDARVKIEVLKDAVELCVGVWRESRDEAHQHANANPSIEVNERSAHATSKATGAAHCRERVVGLLLECRKQAESDEQ